MTAAAQARTRLERVRASVAIASLALQQIEDDIDAGDVDRAELAAILRELIEDTDPPGGFLPSLAQLLTAAARRAEQIEPDRDGDASCPLHEAADGPQADQRPGRLLNTQSRSPSSSTSGVSRSAAVAAQTVEDRANRTGSAVGFEFACEVGQLGSTDSPPARRRSTVWSMLSVMTSGQAAVSVLGGRGVQPLQRRLPNVLPLGLRDRSKEREQQVARPGGIVDAGHGSGEHLQDQAVGDEVVGERW